MGEEVAHLNIEVLPPFWMSWWAYVLYVLAGIGLLFLARRQILKRERERFRLHQIELEVAKNEEVNNMKFRFFTNVSHELRTPLTLIISPLEGIGPDDVNISCLISRIDKENIEEIILALKPSIEGETTMQYIKKILENKNIKITRIATGIPMGTDIDYIDAMTLEFALEGRKDI